MKNVLPVKYTSTHFLDPATQRSNAAPSIVTMVTRNASSPTFLSGFVVFVIVFLKDVLVNPMQIKRSVASFQTHIHAARNFSSLHSSLFII